jgi:hypothetical protein
MGSSTGNESVALAVDRSAVCTEEDEGQLAHRCWMESSIPSTSSRGDRCRFMVTAAVVVLMMVDVPSAHTLICTHAFWRLEKGTEIAQTSLASLRFALLWPN